MTIKGARRNPYTQQEYNSSVESSTWHGGWVKNGDDSLTYYTHNGNTYSGICYRNNPVTYSICAEMRGNGYWTGGWVKTPAEVKVYIDSTGCEHDGSLGTQSNPYSLSIYNEMISNGIWDGGWMYTADGSLLYVTCFPVGMEIGNGCGSGGQSGSGSSGSSGNSSSGSGDNNGSSGCSGGDGSPALGYAITEGRCVAGKINYDYNGVSISGDISLSWSDGYTFGHNGLSVVTVDVRLYSGELEGNNTSVVWVEPYCLSISGSILIKIRNETKRFSISGSFVISPEYYVLVND